MIASVDLLIALGGLGMFLFSLRFLTAFLERSVARRPKSVLDGLLATRFSSLLGGGATTVMVQASSITIVAAMGLLSASMISLEQGYCLMLGATVGTTLKAWLFAFNLDRYGPALIGVSSVALVFVRHPAQREKLEALLAIGFAFFGLDLLAAGLAPLTAQADFQGLMQQFNGLSWKREALGLCTGALLTMAVQSSTAVVFLTVHLAGTGLLDLTGGATIILGANLGATFTPWRASLEYEVEVRRLALAHVLVKLVGVAAVLSFLPYVLQAVVLLVGTFSKGRFPAGEVASLHVFFNLGNALVFVLMARVVMRFLRWWLPGHRRERNTALPLVVRRMLTRTPERGLAEADRHLGHLDQRTKALADQCLEMLLEGVSPDRPMLKQAHLGAHFAETREGLHDLLLRLSRRRLPEDQLSRMQHQLRFLTRCTDLNQQGVALYNLLRSGMVDQQYAFPPTFTPLFTTFQARFDALWLKFHYRRAPEGEEVAALMAAVDDLDREFFRVLSTDRIMRQEQLSWMYDVLEALRLMADHLGPLCEAAPLLPSARALAKGKPVPIPAAEAEPTRKEK